MVKIYRQLEIGEDLTCGGDPGEGVSYCAAVAISKKYHDVPLTFHSRIESSQFGYELNKMGLFIHKKTGGWPLIAVERNIGQATIAKLLDLDYPSGKLYKQKTFDRVAQKVEERIGWMTSSANRRKMLDEMAMDIRQKSLKIYDADILKEMLTFVINERTGEPRPESGSFSDLIMATAIANQLVREYSGGGQWAPNKQEEDDPKRLPLKADDFIVEKFEEPKDWRGV